MIVEQNVLTEVVQRAKAIVMTTMVVVMDWCALFVIRPPLRMTILFLDAWTILAFGMQRIFVLKRAFGRAVMLITL